LRERGSATLKPTEGLRAKGCDFGNAFAFRKLLSTHQRTMLRFANGGAMKLASSGSNPANTAGSDGHFTAGLPINSTLTFHIHRKVSYIYPMLNHNFAQT
jgi:hypothetical protein